MRMSCCVEETRYITAVCGREYAVCASCDNGINDCTEGYCEHGYLPAIGDRAAFDFYTIRGLQDRAVPGEVVEHNISRRTGEVTSVNLKTEYHGEVVVPLDKLIRVDRAEDA